MHVDPSWWLKWRSKTPFLPLLPSLGITGTITQWIIEMPVTIMESMLEAGWVQVEERRTGKGSRMLRACQGRQGQISAIAVLIAYASWPWHTPLDLLRFSLDKELLQIQTDPLGSMEWWSRKVNMSFTHPSGTLDFSSNPSLVFHHLC